MTSGTRGEDSGSVPVLYMAMELSASKWLLGFGAGDGRKCRRRTVDAGSLAALEVEIRAAKEKFGLAPEATVVSCYEAGRDGFWIHRALIAAGVQNHIVESASILVDRRERRAKTDAIDVEALLRMLVRFHRGETEVWRTVRVPSEGDEDRRRLHRERERLKKEMTSLRNRILGLLATQGAKADPDTLDEYLKTARSCDGREFGAAFRNELSRMHARVVVLRGQLAEIDQEQMSQLRSPNRSSTAQKVAQLMCLCGIGLQGAWPLVMEFFEWREFRNRREVGALAGLTGTPFNSGKGDRDQGISKAGNKRIRRLLVELAWLWLRHQPNSALSLWFARKWGAGAKRGRKCGIVALARKLLIALWHFVEHGVIPEGARLMASPGVKKATVDSVSKRHEEVQAARAASVIAVSRVRHDARSSTRIEGVEASVAPTARLALA